MDFDRLNHEASSMGWTFQWTVEEDRPLSPFDPDAPYRWSALLCHAHGNKAIRLSGRASNPDSAHAMATWHLWDALQDIRDADKKRLRKEASEALKSYKRLVR